MKVWKPKDGLRKYIHFKRDGHSIIVKVSSKGVVYFTRNMTQIDLSFLRSHDALIGWAQRMFSSGEPAITIHAELWKPKEPASYITSGIANADKLMVLSVFELPNNYHGAELNVVADVVMSYGLDFIPYMVYEGEKFNNPKAVFAHSCYRGTVPRTTLPKDIPLHEDCEGYVLKNGNAVPFEEPLKVKQELTADLVVMGYTQGKGKYEGLIGSITGGIFVDDKLKAVADVGGFDDATRHNITTNAMLYRGKVFEVKYQYVGRGGRLRHPRFIRWRNDKPADQCTELT